MSGSCPGMCMTMHVEDIAQRELRRLVFAQLLDWQVVHRLRGPGFVLPCASHTCRLSPSMMAARSSR